MEKNGSEFSDRLLQFRATYKVFGEKKVFGYFLTFCRRVEKFGSDWRRNKMRLRLKGPGREVLLALYGSIASTSPGLK